MLPPEGWVGLWVSVAGNRSPSLGLDGSGPADVIGCSGSCAIKALAVFVTERGLDAPATPEPPPDAFRGLHPRRPSAGDSVTVSSRDTVVGWKDEGAGLLVTEHKSIGE